jgi:hypothetical protein
MVICKDKAVCRNEGARSSAQEHNSVLDARRAVAVNLLAIQNEAVLLHVRPWKLVELREHPHPFIGKGGDRNEDKDA